MTRDKNKQRILFYCSGMDDVLSGKSNVAGIQVQMSFWAKEFVKKKWKVYALTKGNTKVINRISFIEQKENIFDKCRLSIIKEFVYGFVSLLKTKADILVFSGASRGTFLLVLFCKLFRTKLIFLSASDTDFLLGKELVSGSSLNVCMYRKSIYYIDYFVTQNLFQSQKLKQNYGRDSLIIPNIWFCSHEIPNDVKRYDAVWVANFRRLKRAEWFLNLAEKMPSCRFAIVGGSTSSEIIYFEEMKLKAELLANTTFFGAKPFYEVNEIIGQSKLLVCSSEFEGFPNTFLQAWAADVPVVSTVDPSGVIQKYNLGCYITDESELQWSVSSLLQNEDLYKTCQKDINSYFYDHYDADVAYEKLMDYLNNTNVIGPFAI